MAADDEKFAAFLPVTKIIPISPSEAQRRPEEEKKAGTKRQKASKASAVMEDDGTPNSFNKRDLAMKL